MDECIVCFEETDNFMIFTCKHKMCYNCLKTFLKKSNICPVCEHIIITPFKSEPLLPYVIIPRRNGILDTSHNSLSNHIDCTKICCVFFIFSCLIFYIVNFVL
jgi:hypothetical protein